MRLTLLTGTVAYVSGAIAIGDDTFGYDETEDGADWVGPRPVCPTCGDPQDRALWLSAQRNGDVDVLCDSCQEYMATLPYHDPRERGDDDGVEYADPREEMNR